jgi:hypothetical protein
MSAEVPRLESGQIAVADLRVVGDDVLADVPIARAPYALRILHSLYDHAASKVECPDRRDIMKREAREALEGCIAAELVIAHPRHEAIVSSSGLKMLCPTIALTSRGRNVVEAHSKRKIAMSSMEVVDSRDVVPAGNTAAGQCGSIDGKDVLS